MVALAKGAKPRRNRVARSMPWSSLRLPTEILRAARLLLWQFLDFCHDADAARCRQRASKGAISASSR